MDLTLSLNANRAMMGALASRKADGEGACHSGRHDSSTPSTSVSSTVNTKGRSRVSLAEAPTFRLRGALSNIDVAAAMAFAGSPGTLTGRLSGRLDLTGWGTDASQA